MTSDQTTILTVSDDAHLRDRIAETLAHRVEISPGDVIEQPRYDMADAVIATLRGEASRRRG